MYQKGQIVKYKDSACVVILAWENDVLLSPLCSEQQFVVDSRSILGIIRQFNTISA